MKINLIMRGMILGSFCNKNKKFIADTGTSEGITPRSEKNKLQWMLVDEGEPDYEGVTGMQLTVIRQTEMLFNLKAMRNTKVLRAIVCEEAGDEILVNSDTLIQ